MPAALNLSAPALSLAATSFQPSTVVMVLPGCARTMGLEPRIELRSMAFRSAGGLELVGARVELGGDFLPAIDGCDGLAGMRQNDGLGAQDRVEVDGLPICRRP